MSLGLGCAACLEAGIVSIGSLDGAQLLLSRKLGHTFQWKGISIGGAVDI